MNLNILPNLIFPGSDLSLSSDSHMKLALPTTWSSGTNPHMRESAEL